MGEDKTEFEKNRRMLLEFYNSQTMTHGGYIIAVVIGSLTLISTLISTWGEFAGNIIARLIFYFILSLLFTLGSYFSGRTVFWAYMASGIIAIKKEDLQNIDDQQHPTILTQLQECSLNRFQRERGWPHSMAIWCYYRSRAFVTILALMTYLILLLIFEVLPVHLSHWNVLP